jgi:hypothetical protein
MTSWAAVNARRLARHRLTEPLPRGTDPAAVAAATVGVHAQVLSAAEISAALRIEGGTRADVRRALWQDRTLVKTFGPRGTVHLLPAEHLARWMAALGAIPSRSPFPDGVRMTPEETDVVVAAIGEALRERELTVDELTEALGDLVGLWAVDPVMPAFQTMWPRWRQVTDRAAFAGVLCYGPDRARKVTYTHPRRWAGDLSPVDPDEAVSWLVAEYLRAYGPATAASFAQWVGAPATWAAERFAAAPGLVPDELDGEPVWDLPDASYDVPSPAGVMVLPYFDAFVVGSRPRHLLFPGPARDRALVPSGQAGNYPVLLVDGEVAGVWHQRRSGRRVAVTVEPLRRLSKVQVGLLEQQVSRLAGILEADTTLTIGPVTVGPHA